MAGITITSAPNYVIVEFSSDLVGAAPGLRWTKRTVKKTELNFVLDDDKSMVTVEIAQQAFNVSNKFLVEHPDCLPIISIDGVTVDSEAENAETLFTQLLTLMP